MRNIYALIIAASASIPACAADFFDTSIPEKQFSIGLRFGVNTTNRNVASDTFNEWNCNSWGTGIDAGAVVDINIRNYFSLQPGFFYESRSGKYAYACQYDDAEGTPVALSQFGRFRSYNFTIPIMAAFHFNITDQLRWNAEIGPYVQIILKNSLGDGFIYPSPAAPETGLPSAPDGFSRAEASNFDFGFKFGSSLTILDHYTVGFHYMAGWLDVWKDSALGGRNKGWVFSIGYDF